MEWETRRNLPVGVFDSGVGGISVLRTVMKLLPQERFIYYGDTANVPYGERTLSQIRRLTLRATAELVDHGVKALLVACNTATAAGIDELRSRHDFPVLGMEPALKPAMEDERKDAVVVMATPATLQLDKFARLLHRFEDTDRIIPLPCPGLVRHIETDGPGSRAVGDYLDGLFDGLGPRPIGSVVLGCTHYSFIAPDIAVRMPAAAIYDGNRGTAVHLSNVLDFNNILRRDPSEEPKVVFLSSDRSSDIRALFGRFMEMPLA